MVKKIVSGCLAFLLCLTMQSVNAASTCDYSEQVELGNVAASVVANYEIKKVVFNGDTDSMEENMDVSDERVYKEGYPYFLVNAAYLNIYNITNDVYVKVTNDDGFNQTYRYENTSGGEIVLFVGNLDEAKNYKVTIYSNKIACPDEQIRVVDVSVPIFNSFYNNQMCASIPNYEYCKEFISEPFRASDTSILENIAKEYNKYMERKKEEEEEKNLSWIDKIGKFVNENKVIVYSIAGIIVIAGVVTTIVILKKRRSRVL